jgi:hypothetical protein
MVTIEAFVMRMKEMNVNSIANMTNHELNPLLMSAWEERPLLCYDGIAKREILAMVTWGDQKYVIHDLAEEMIRTLTGTILVVKAKFDTWEEAASYFANKESTLSDEAILNRKYAKKASAKAV